MTTADRSYFAVPWIVDQLIQHAADDAEFETKQHQHRA